MLLRKQVAFRALRSAVPPGASWTCKDHLLQSRNHLTNRYRIPQRCQRPRREQARRAPPAGVVTAEYAAQPPREKAGRAQKYRIRLWQVCRGRGRWLAGILHFSDRHGRDTASVERGILAPVRKGCHPEAAPAAEGAEAEGWLRSLRCAQGDLTPVPLPGWEGGTGVASSERRWNRDGRCERAVTLRPRQRPKGPKLKAGFGPFAALRVT